MSIQNFRESTAGIDSAERSGLYRKLFVIAAPIMLSNFLQTLYNMTDTYFLGRLGADQVASPSISFNIVFLVLLFSGGFSQAGRTLISQSFGKGDREKSNFYLGQLTSMMIIAGIVLMPLIQLLIPWILSLLSVPQRIFADTEAYLRIVMASMPFMFLSFAMQAAFQGRGDSITPFVLNIVTVTFNILFDWFLIFGIGPFPEMGVQGAAAATFIARTVNAFLALLVLSLRKDGFRLTLTNMKPDFAAWRLITKIGLPMSLGQSASALGFTVLQGIVNTYGTSVIAAFNVGNRIINLFMMPAMGIGQGVAVLVGQSLGAKRKDLAMLTLKQAATTGGIFIVVSMTITFFFGNYVTGFFVPDEEVIYWGAKLFRLVSPSVVFFGMFTIFSGVFQGSGDTKPVAFLNVFRLWGVRVPVAFLLCIVMGIGPTGIWVGMILSNLLTALIAFGMLITRPWADTLDLDTI